MRILVLAALSISSVIRGSQADDGADVTTTTLLRSGARNNDAKKPPLFSENETLPNQNNESAPATGDPLADHGGGKMLDMMEKKKKKQNKRKKNKRKKRSSKNGKSNKDSESERESDDNDNGDGNNTSGPGDRPQNYETKFVDGGNHKLPPHSDHNNIVLEQGSTITVTSGTSITAKGGTYNYRLAAAISVSESSLKVQGMEIYIKGASYADHQDANFRGGGDGIQFMPGSKGMIGCEEFQPPVTAKRQCAMGNAAPFELAESLACNVNEFCILSKGVCNNKSGAHYGYCETKPHVCTMDWNPVCGCNGVTYGNACGASSAGESISRDGQCDKDPEDPLEPMYCEIDSSGRNPCKDDEACLLDTGICYDYSGSGPDMDFDKAMSRMNRGKCVQTVDYCKEIPREVCTCDGETYPNECEMMMRGGSLSRFYGKGVAHRGECKSDPPVEPTSCKIYASGRDNCGSDEFCMLPGSSDCDADPDEELTNVGICMNALDGRLGLPKEVCTCDGETIRNELYGTTVLYGKRIAYRGRCEDEPPNPSEVNCEIDAVTGRDRGDCSRREYCMVQPLLCMLDSLTGMDTAGVCTPLPETCDEEPVCGCDGVTYQGQCHAHDEGVAISHKGECTLSPIQPPVPSPVMPPVAPEPRRCESGPGVIHFACNRGEYCDIEPGSCKIGSWDINRGFCKTRPTRGCPENYDPVCGCDGSSYDNDCFAKARGTSISYKGKCDSGGSVVSSQCNIDRRSWLSNECDTETFCQLEDGQCDIPDGKGTRGACAQRPERCTEQYDPVCGCNGYTFSNKCYAHARGMSILHEGPCKVDPAEPARACQQGYCRNPMTDKCTNKKVKCAGNPCSDATCGPGEKCIANYCGGCHAVCTAMNSSVETPAPPPSPTAPPSCPRNQCPNPDTGDCAKEVRCLVDPCAYTTCVGPGEKCIANYCGGCNAICAPINAPIIVSPAAAPQLELPKSLFGEPEVEELKIETPIAWPVDTGIVARPVVECDDSMIQIIGGDGNLRSDGGSGRGGVALRVYGQTNVQINGATLSGGMGSIRGLALEIAEADVTIHSAISDGGILVAKRGSLHVYGGTFSGGDIEILGDTSSVSFYGCFDDLMFDKHEDLIQHWSFRFSGEMSRIGVMVHQGGNAVWNEAGYDCAGVVDQRPCPADQCYDSTTGDCSMMVACAKDPCSDPNPCGPGYGCFPDYCGGCHARCAMR